MGVVLAITDNLGQLVTGTAQPGVGHQHLSHTLESQRHQHQ